MDLVKSRTWTRFIQVAMKVGENVQYFSFNRIFRLDGLL